MTRKNKKYSVCKVCRVEYLKRNPRTKQCMCDECEAKRGVCTTCGGEMPLYSKKDGSRRLTCSQTCHNRRISSDPEIVARMAKSVSVKSRAMWQDPEYRKRHSEAMQPTYDSEKWRKSKSEMLKALWQTTGFQKINSEASQRKWDEPGYKEQYGRDASERWNDLGYRARTVASMIRAQNDPAVSKRKSEILREILGTDKHRKMLSAISKKRWEDGIYDNRPRVPTKRTGIEILIENEFNRLKIDGFLMGYVVGRFRLDFGFPLVKLGVECDGIYWHSLPGIPEKDMRRDIWLANCGWTIIRLGEGEINDNPSRTVADKVVPVLDGLFEKSNRSR